MAANVLEKHPEKKIVILERGLLPTGASTKNAGFASTNSKISFTVIKIKIKDLFRV